MFSPTDLICVLAKQRLRSPVSGALLTPANSSLDHIVPVSRGGRHVLGNVRWVLNQENRMKSDLTDREVLALSLANLRHRMATGDPLVSGLPLAICHHREVSRLIGDVLDPKVKPVRLHRCNSTSLSA